MACGCGVFGKGGYDSPAIAAYAWGVVLQILAGGVMLLASGRTKNFKEIFDTMWYDGRMPYPGDAMTALGCIHVVLALTVAVILILGFFLSPCFLLPLCVVSWIQFIFCLVASGVAGYYWNEENEGRSSAFRIPEITVEDPFPTPGAAKSMGFDSGLILLGGILSLSCVAPYSRASTIEGNTPAPEVGLYVPAATLGMTISAVFLVSSTHLAEINTLGSIWLVVVVALGIVINIFSCCCCPSLFNVIVGAAFAAVAIFGAFTAFYTGAWYSIGRYAAFNVFNNMLITEGELEVYKIYVLMNFGNALLAAFLLATGITVLSVFAAIYGLRSAICCCGKSSSVKTVVVEKKVEVPADSSPA